MSALRPAEIRPGLAVFLDRSVLGRSPGVLTNACEDDPRNQPVDRDGYFLVVAEVEGGWLCTPLYSMSGAGRVALLQPLKSGPGEGWIGRASWFAPRQAWHVPAAAMVAASHRERSRGGHRPCYAERVPAALAAVVEALASDAPFRPLPV